MERLGRIRRIGYSVTRGELAPDVVGIAAPIRDENKPVGGILSRASPRMRDLRPWLGRRRRLPVLSAPREARRRCASGLRSAPRRCCRRATSATPRTPRSPCIQAVRRHAGRAE
ncbi:IclR family transcriptional regulator domain-containing protein [Streptomyces sp. NBC_00286]|uniref:IclR family transcriptional regulator domain-containing protein n=1 Tax=Streptomyces sp. NBC_00286 TaxID=2975701 RepID=UPI002E2D84F6|nr:IclR family transcriptional regulator C-terminal domain-containing protein [Streptomyces sp. NBC_00286]